ncbi:Tat binding protein 1(TBP-1)-interacting protein [Giardia muris]|uniref:Tat binding protein 1(TBP-1)-interacting protein n=1 Tax=Giardia muris TaxID=5742 RepID=A0A4Z1SWB1_GIAMU|nr:Tat binding protein 1(TBP-1)-interacting protein [Giardia muris]|eukprot:TNJ27828.1 Tat binding protein 1(TBP-1)-interacting protein [Giardia muris]
MAAAKEVFAAVRDLMKSTNRPQNVQTALNNTGSRFGKTAIQKALDELVAQNECIYTEIGKTGKLYLWNQALLPVLSDAELMAIGAEIATLREEHDRLLQQKTTLEIQQRRLGASLPTETLLEEVERLEAEVKENTDKLKLIDSAGAGISDADMLTYQKQYRDALMAWQTRRTRCMEFIENMSEGLDVKPMKLLDQLGLEPGLPASAIAEMKRTQPPQNVTATDIRRARAAKA